MEIGIFAIFKRLPDRSTSKSNMATGKSFLDDLRAIVLENYTDERFGVSELVEKFGISRSQLHRKLKVATGQSVSQFIREIRLEEAAKLLRENDFTASEVAYKVGFNSATYFNTCFNDYFGYPPGEAKHHTTSLHGKPHMVERPPRKNKWVLVWLIALTVITVGFFGYSYLQKEKKAALADSGKPKTIAVLPFKNWSGDPELEYVSDGMTDAVIRRISAISDIEKVVPFNSIIVYKNSDKSLADIAKDLNVEYILAGNFKLSGTEVMSNLDLIEVDSNDYLWSLEYTGVWNTEEIFEMQAAVAENVAENMNANISSREKIEINRVLTDNVEAYQLYLQAVDQYERLSQVGFENAIDLYEKSIEKDPSFIDAHVGLGRTYMLCGLVWGVISQEKAWSNAEPILLKAQELDEQQNRFNEFYIKSVLATGYFYYELDIKKAEEWHQEMVRNLQTLNYTDFSFDYSRKTSRYHIALDILERELRLYPEVSDAYWQRGLIHYMAGEKEVALKQLEMYDSYYSDNFFYLQETSKWYFYMGEVNKSKNNLDNLLKSFSDRPPIVNWLVAVHEKIEGNDEVVEEQLSILRELHKNNASGSPAWFIALYYSHIKDYDSAFEWLNKSFEAREVELTWFKEEPMLQPVKSDPRYIELYNKIGFDVIEPLTPAD